MKKALLVAMMLAATCGLVEAASHSLKACTKDSVKVELVANFEGETDAVVKDVQAKFAAVAKSVSYEVLVSNEGYEAFISSLSSEDLDALQGFDGAPVNVGACGE